MDIDQETPRVEKLRKLPYSELKQVAAKYGIVKKMKAKKLIAAIMSKSPEEIFSTPSAKELNSSRKNKQKKFDEDQTTPLATPRRGTYSVESPTSVKTEDLSSVSLAVNTSAFDASNVTIGRGSERKLRPRKVSFMSPAVTPRTPRSQSLRNRPKTPVASRTPLNGSVSLTTPSGQHKRRSMSYSAIETTPQAKIVKFESGLNVVSSKFKEIINSTPLPSFTKMSKEDSKMASTKLFPPNTKSSAAITVVEEQASVKKRTTPGAQKAVSTKDPTSIKKGATPNFRRIHQKAFDKMESIDDYQKRKLLNSAKKIDQRPDLKSKVTKAKSKIPSYSGIPFIPSVSLHTKMNKKMRSVDTCKAAKENIFQSVQNKSDLKGKNFSRKDTPQATRPKMAMNISRKESPRSVKSKSKFDLKQSLSRKLGYIPYKGPLKPLSGSDNVPASSFLNAKEPVVNKVVKENRLRSRTAIRGVRMNRRFELQMKNRKLDK